MFLILFFKNRKMKRLQFLVLLFVLITSCSNNITSEGSDTQEKANIEKEEAPVLAANRVEVIDFYGKRRCITCKAIEANALFTVETYFPEEQKAGKVIFKTVNVDDKENYAIAEKFEASGTALYLNVIKDGKETHIDLTEQAFLNGKNKEVFCDELKFFINNELTSL
jgi:hypothetical protein